MDRPLRGRPRARPGLRLRHRLQRQRDRRRVDPYPPPRRAGAGLRRDGPRRARRRRRSSASCSTPSRSARRRTAASRSAGTGSSRCSSRRGLDPRGHRLPEDRRRLRPADRRAGADHAPSSARRPGVDVLPAGMHLTVSRSDRLRPLASRRPAPGRCGDDADGPVRRSPSGCGRARSTRWSARTTCSARRRRCAGWSTARRAGRAAVVGDPLGAARHRQDHARAPGVARPTGRRFVELSAVNAGVKDVRAVIERGPRRPRPATAGRPCCSSTRSTASPRPSRTRCCPAVENRWVTLVAATTENPSFSVISPLLSRSLLLTLSR